MKYATVALALFAATGLCSPRRQMPFDDDTPQICWRLCATEDLQCPENWESKQFGDCWTCCRSIQEATAQTPTTAKNVICK
ncbi:hypothetical protein BFW01_g7956 [Lasiodiplodia theobromae]|uniref:Uncharacterized protein n=1 Tax=Lasiodiplodia theobromae TaxID=45133 RepID=A0A5N5DFZ9_9PEZI|nr:hypothetical protein DBV05_g4486 [Lasiodiplodia theobromae]KAF9637060.1 hypothetical protein BFW01_g7956 [Lasiodiplodia theobromae]